MDPSSGQDELTWRIPAKYGYGEAVQSAGTVVAPLLAGFSITLTVLVVDRADAIWSADLALSLLVAAAAVLLGAIQCAYSARQYLVTPDEIEAWWPELGSREHPRYAIAWQMTRSDQRAHAEMHRRWAARFRGAYHAGVLLVLLALIAILLPPDEIAASRWVPIGLAGLAALAEATWVLAVVMAGRWDRSARTEESEAAEAALRRRLVRRIVPRYEQRAVSGTPFSDVSGSSAD